MAEEEEGQESEETKVQFCWRECHLLNFGGRMAGCDLGESKSYDILLSLCVD